MFCSSVPMTSQRLFMGLLRMSAIVRYRLLRAWQAGTLAERLCCSLEVFLERTARQPATLRPPRASNGSIPSLEPLRPSDRGDPERPRMVLRASLPVPIELESRPVERIQAIGGPDLFDLGGLQGFVLARTVPELAVEAAHPGDRGLVRDPPER